ncbi:hypothetical protein MICRO8M_110020 [Microbacterium sp. 8M]|nr:hypothetical protein MICRO8M_110020 [Microbacterium sp. 8M]
MTGWRHEESHRAVRVALRVQRRGAARDRLAHSRAGRPARALGRGDPHGRDPVPQAGAVAGGDLDVGRRHQARAVSRGVRGRAGRVDPHGVVERGARRQRLGLDPPARHPADRLGRLRPDRRCAGPQGGRALRRRRGADLRIPLGPPGSGFARAVRRVLRGDVRRPQGTLRRAHAGAAADVRRARLTHQLGRRPAPARRTGGSDEVSDPPVRQEVSG